MYKHPAIFFADQFMLLNLNICVILVSGRRRRARRPRPSMIPGDPNNVSVMEKDGMPSANPFYQYLTSSDFDERQKQVAPSDVWSGLKEQTTAHGIPHITHAKGNK